MIDTDIEQERAVVLNAAVEIANQEGYSKKSKLDACHEVAKRVLAIAKGEVPAEKIVDNVIPLNRRTEEVEDVSDYDIVRLRGAAAARAMFGELEAA